MHGSQGGGQRNNKRKRTWHMWSMSSSTTTTSVAAAFEPTTTTSVAVYFEPTTTTSVAVYFEPTTTTSVAVSFEPTIPPDVRKINVGDCALFKPPHDSPLFIGIIRSVASDKENNLKLEVNWLYRPGEVKLGKGVALEAAPNEVFYSFHRDKIPAASLLHQCKVAFLPKGVELPSGVSSFVCRRVYDITNKCLWWLTDRDYINGRQEEVDQLLNRTRSEMHATMQQQQGGCSPKPMNGPTSATQLKNSQETVQTSTGSLPSQSKGRKRERCDQVSETLKRERISRSDDGEASQKVENSLKSEISRITERGGLVNFEGVERLVQLIQPGKREKRIDWSSRSLFAGVIAATERFDCLSRFVQLSGLVVLDEWLQEVHKGKVGDSSSDKSVEEFLLVLLRALDKLPVNLDALQTCNIGRSVNHLRFHRNSEIQKKARSLVDTWKKRVEAEMNISDAKSGSGQAVPWTARSKPGGSHGGSKQTAGSSDAAIRSSLTQLSSSKSASTKNVQLESNGKSAGASPGSLKSLPASPSASLRDGQPRLLVTGTNPELPQIVTKDEKSSSSSQSHTNSQCSSEHGKNLVPSGKEDARSSTAGSTSMSKISGSVSRYQRSPNSLHGASSCVSQGELFTVRNSAEVNNYKLIVKIPNRGHSPVRSIIGGTIDDPSFRSSRASSPVHSEKHDQSFLKLKDSIDAYRNIIASDMNTESWQSNDLKDVGSDEGDGSPVAALDCEHRVTANDLAKPADARKPALASSGHEAKPTEAHDASFSTINALIEASDSALIADDVGMNLLAGVAARESSKSGIESPTDSPPNVTMEPCTNCNGISQVNEDDHGSSYSTTERELAQNEDKCMRSSGKSDDLVGAASLPTVEMAADIEGFHEKKTSLKDEIHEFAAERWTNCSIVANERNDCSSPKQETQKTTEVSSSCLAENVDDDKKDPNRGMNSNPIAEHKTFEVVAVPEPIVKNVEASVTSASIKGSPSRISDVQKVEETMIESVDASGGVDVGAKRSNDEENAASQTPLKVDEAHVGLGVTDLKNVCGIEKLTGEEASGIGLGKLSSRKDSDALATEEPSMSSKCPQLDDVEGIALEERMSSGATGSLSVPLGISDIDGKLGFDLNEGLDMDDTKCIESVGVSTSIRLLGPVPSFSVPSTSTVLPASVTITAAAKGPFVPPEDLLRTKGELGWKGSAATSAFRPAEPRRFSETPLGNGSIHHVDATSSKQGRPPLEFDLNVADERILEDMGCQNSTPGKSNNNSNSLLIGGQMGTASLCCSAGIDLDLNKVDEVPESGYQSNIRRFEVPHPSAGLSSASSTAGGSSNDGSSRRNFDLNNGPAVDEVVAEPSLYNQAWANLIIQPPVRINNVDIGSLSSWYPPGSSYSAVPIPSLLPDRGEQHFPVVGASGGPQRVVGGPSVSAQFSLETFRGPVLSSSAALPFPSMPFQYPVFPFSTSIPLPSATFSGGSSAYMDLSSGARFCIPAVPSQLIGTSTAVSSQYPRPYVVTFPDISNPAVDSSRKFAGQGLDLNAGPGLPDVQGRDETVPILPWQVPNSNSISLAEEQARMYHLAGNVLKRKEPDSGWDGDRLSFKQTSLK